MIDILSFCQYSPVSTSFLQKPHWMCIARNTLFDPMTLVSKSSKTSGAVQVRESNKVHHLTGVKPSNGSHKQPGNSIYSKLP